MAISYPTHITAIPTSTVTSNQLMHLHHTNKLCAVIAPPASGKSYWARTYDWFDTCTLDREVPALQTCSCPDYYSFLTRFLVASLSDTPEATIITLLDGSSADALGFGNLNCVVVLPSLKRHLTNARLRFNVEDRKLLIMLKRDREALRHWAHSRGVKIVTSFRAADRFFMALLHPTIPYTPPTFRPNVETE